MIDDIANLYKQILEKENSKEKEVPVQKEEDITLNESVEEPFDSFLAKLGEKISEELIDKNPQDERFADIVSATLPENSNKYIQELQKVDKPNHLNILSEEEKKINNIISEQIQEEIGKVKTQISRMAIEGGGGSVAVQYANGGTMNGDLNVMGRYLSAGVDLATLIGTGGGGGLSGTTDRLISGSQMLKLNSDGTINFPDNTITPQDETILTLESTKLLDNYYNRLSLSPYGFFASDHNENSITIDSTNNEILIDSQNTYFWKFNNQGALEGPFGTLSISGNLSASGRIYQNGNDLQSEIESISSFALSTKTTVQSNSASWNYQGSDIKALTAGWVGGNNAYTNLVANSAAYLSGSITDLSFLSVSGNWNSTYTTVQQNSASWAIDSTIDTGVRALTSNWQNTFTTVQTNSSTWDYQGSDIKSLTAGWVGGNNAYTNLVANSASYLSAVDLSFLSVSGNWDSTYTTVQNNSATTWNYQGTDLKSLSANWQSTYTTLSSNSASYIRANTSDATPVYSIRAITQTEYDAIAIKNPNTIYFITT